MKQVIITGGRDYFDMVMINDVLDFLNPDVVIQGGARGADALAKEWAENNNKEVVTVEADWDYYGNAAGPRRNIEMLEKFPDAVLIAFPGGKGTTSCVRSAYERNRIILQVHK